jgi:hypothetical protein
MWETDIGMMAALGNNSSECRYAICTYNARDYTSGMGMWNVNYSNSAYPASVW